MTDRKRGLVVLGILALSLNACGGGGGDDAGPVPAPQVDPGSITTLDGVQAHYAVALSRAALPPNAQASSVGRGSAAAAAARVRALAVPLAVTDCPVSGTVDTTVETLNVDSPFDDNPFDVEHRVYAECVQSAFATDGMTLETQNGLMDVATKPVGDAIVIYETIGDRASGDEFESSRRHTPDGEGEVTETRFLSYGRFDLFVNSDEFDVRADATIAVEYLVDDVVQASGSFRLGTPDEPFRSYASEGVTSGLLEGEMEIQTDTCEPGPVQVSTPTLLHFDVDTNRMTAGQIELTSSEGTATITFNENGSVTLQDTEGETRTLEPEQVPQAYESACFGEGV